MNFFTAIVKGTLNAGRELMILDWDKAAKLIKDKNPKRVMAGLRGDWEYTGGIIYENSEAIIDNYTYLASTWATPQLDLDGHIVDCYKMQSEAPDWDAETKWPKSALEILKK